MKLLAVSVLLVSGVAHAEPARYVEGGAMIGFGAPALMNLVGTVSAGARLDAAPVWLHAQVESGPAADDQGGGTIGQIRAGVESRSCTRGSGLCALVGLDVGGMHGTWTGFDSSEDVRAIVAVPRLGLEAGGQHLVVTATMELAEMLAGTHTYTSGPADSAPRSTGEGSAPTMMTSPASGLGAFELGLGVGYRW